MKTFIDIGSYSGEELEWGLDNGYEVICFEPNVDMKPFLSKYKDRATIIYAAAWDEDGVSKFYKRSEGEVNNDNKDQGRTLIFEKSNIDHFSYDDVPTVNIGKYLKELDRDVDILKVDTEGAEYVILESIFDHFGFERIRRILVEDHEDRIPSSTWKENKSRVLRKIGDVVIEPWVNRQQL